MSEAYAAENIESRKINVHAANPSAELSFTVVGTVNEAEAIGLVAAASPWLWQVDTVFLPRETITVEPDSKGYMIWRATVRYAPVQVTGDSSYSFDTGGGSQRIYHSKATQRFGANAPNFKGAIGVTNGKDVEGVDIALPVFNFAETHTLDDEFVTPGYKGVLFALTGRTNSEVFRGLQPGECLFLGASGAKRGVGDWELTYRFAASPNATNLQIGDITVASKKGWEYLWVLYEDTEDSTAKMLVKQPLAAYVERVYDEANFAALGIG